MKNIVKLLRKKYQAKNQKHSGVIGAVMALCMSLNPWSVPYAEAGEIVRTGQEANLMQNNKAEIYAGAVARDSSTRVGLNTFKTFKVDAGQIANMYFHQKDASGNAVNPVDLLLNVVNTRIDVNGTVNAIKNSRIDGNLVFLSKDGMVVGKSGVINAGSLTVMTPNYTFNSGIDITKGYTKDTTAYTPERIAREFYTETWSQINAGTIALNKDASIVVKGTINTAGGIHLKAPNVVVGGTYTDAAGVEQQADAKLRTGVDFASLVNTSDVPQLYVQNLNGNDVNTRLEAKSDGSYQLLMHKEPYIDAEGKTQQKIVLTSNTKAADGSDLIIDGDGSIKLEAYNQYFNVKDENLGLLYAALGTAASGNNTIQAGVKVAQGSVVEALGDINISATATNKNTEGFLGFDVTEWNFATLAMAGVYRVKADVDIDGTVTAGAFQPRSTGDEGVLQVRPADVDDVGKLNVTAKSEGSYSSEDWKGTKAVANAKNLLMSRDAFSQTVAGEGKGEFLADALNSFEFGLGMVDSTANVTVGTNAKLTATANTGFKTETTGTGEDAETKIVADKDTEIYSGGAMRINAINTTSVKIAKRVQNKAYDPNRVHETEVSDVVNFIASYGEAVGGAKVTINGSLESNGSIQVGAVSTVKDSVKGVITKPAGASDKPNLMAGSAYVNFSANFVNLTNKSDVIMGTGSSIVANKNKEYAPEDDFPLGDGVQLTSMTREEIAVKSAIKTDSNAVANIGIGVNVMDTNANMHIDGTITAGSIDLKAADSLEGNDLEVNNEDVGMDDKWFDPIEDWTKDHTTKKNGFQWATNTVNRLFGGLKDKKVQSNYANGVSDKISGGAIFGIEYATNKANLTLDTHAQLISTGGDVSLKSTQETGDSGFVVDNEITNAQGKAAGIMAGAAVGVQSMDNQANLVIVGRDLPTEVSSTLANTVTSAGAINVEASSAYKYDRAKSTINDLVFVQVYNTIKDEFGENSNVAKDAKAIIDFLNGELNSSGTLQEQYERMIALEQAKQRLLENKTYNRLKGLQGQVGDFLENIKSLFTADSYLQFYVANATSIAADDAHTYDIANSFGFTGSLGIQSVDNKANILVGKNAKLIAEDEVKVDSTVERTTTAAVGKVGNEVFFMLPNLKSNNGNKNGVGVTVGVNNNDANSSIIIAEGATLQGSSVELNSKNDLLDVAFVYGGIESTEAGGAGMINVMAGDDNTLALVDDEAVLEAVRATKIASTSNINRWNITGETGESGTKTFGAALNIIDYTSNSIAGVSDNDFKTITDKDDDNKKNGVRDIDKVIKSVLGKSYSTNNLGTATNTLNGSIKASSLDVNSKTEGIIENLSVASGASGTSHDAVGGAAAAGGAGAAAAVNSMQQQIDAKGADNTGWQIAGVGSASLNFAKGDTASYLENTKVTIAPSAGDGTLKLTAEDSSTWGAYSGAAAISKAGAGSQFSHSAALAGAVAANKSTRNTLSQVKDAQITNALNVINSAKNSGSEVAIGLSLAADTGTKTDASGFDVSVSGSVNFLDDTTKANILNSNVIGATDDKDSSLTSVINYAFDNAVQVAGGVSVDYAKTNVNAGVSVTVEYVNNKVEANIEDSQLGVVEKQDKTKIGHELKLLQNYAATNLTQLAGAVSVGLANGEHTLGSGAGAVVYDSFNNTVKATVKNATITSKSMDVQALDAKIRYNSEDGILTKDNTATDNPAVAKLANKDIYVTVATINNTEQEITLVRDANGDLQTKEEILEGATKAQIYYLAKDSEGTEYWITTYTMKKKVDGAFVDIKGEEAQKLANGDSEADNKIITGVDEEQLPATADAINNTEAGSSQAIYTSEKVALDNKGSLILNTAVSFSKVNQEGGHVNLAPALLFDSATNTYEAAVSGSTITLSSATATADTVTGNFNLKANSDVTVFSVAAGAAVNNNNSKGVAVAGSRVAQEISNTTKAVLSDSKVTADKVDVEAKADDALISVAGNFDYSKDVGAGVGGAWAKNKLTNTTGAYIYGSELTAANAAKGLDLSVQGTNHTKIWAIAGGGSINDADASLVTVQGAYAHNEGVNNTYAIVDASEKVKEETDNTKYKRSKITNANAITVATDDNSKEVAVAGAVTGSSNSKAMLGGALATNTTEADAEKTGSEVAKQNNKAALNNTDITVLKKTDPVRISVHAKDDSTKFAMAIGASKVANDANIFGVEGDRAINNLNKAIRAEMLNTNIDKTSEATSNSSKVELKAKNDALMVTTADTFAFNGGNVDLGIGSAANDSHIDTEAVLDGGTIQAQSLKVHADSLNRITNVGIGVVAGSVNNSAFTLTGVGNYASNNLINNTKAQIKNATITTNGTTAVLADSTDRIRNYIGSLGAKYNKGSGANIGLGASIGINTIGGDTEASVSSSTITALGNDDGVKTDNHSVDADENGKNKGTITTIAKDAAANIAKTGLVIDAQAKHNIYDVGINVGVMLSSKAGGGTGVPIAAGGAVMLNDITGNTKALLEKTDVNNNLNANSAKADVTVKAFDEIDSYNWAINIEGAVGGTVGVAAGAATTKDDYNRNTSALIQGDATVLDDGIAKKNWVKANKLAVEALSHTDLYEVGVGSNISATGGDSATVSVSAGAVVMIDKQSNKTIAGITNINSLNEGLKVASDRVANLTNRAAQADIAAAIAEYGVGVTAGIGAVYVDDDTLTEAGVVDSTLEHWEDSTSTATYDDSVTANNNTKITVSQWEAGVAIAPIGVNLGILINKNNINSFTGVTVSGSTIGAANRKASMLTAAAINKLNTSFTNVDIGLGTVFGLGVTYGDAQINTSNLVNISGSTLYGHDITTAAKEIINVDQRMADVTVGIVGWGNSYVNTTIGTDVKKEYTAQNNKTIAWIADEVKQKLEKEINKNTSDSSDSTIGKLKKAKLITGINDDGSIQAKSLEQDPNLKAEPIALFAAQAGSTKESLDGTKYTTSQGDVVALTNSHLFADSTVTAKAEMTHNVDQRTGTGTVSAIGGYSKSNLEVSDNVGVKVVNSNLKAKAINLQTAVSGELYGLAVEGGVNGFGQFGISCAKHSGNSFITILKGNAAAAETVLEAESGINVSVNDTTSTEAKVVGAGLSVVAGSNLMSEATDESNAVITINGSTLGLTELSHTVQDEEAQEQYEVANAIAISTDKQNKVKSSMLFAGANVIQAMDNYAKAIAGKEGSNGTADTGYNKSEITMGTGNTFIAGAVNLNTNNAPNVEAWADFDGVKEMALNGPEPKAEAYGTSKVTVNGSNNFYVNDLYISTDVTRQKDNNKELETAKATSLNVTAFNAFTAETPEAHANVGFENVINISESTYKGWDAEYKGEEASVEDKLGTMQNKAKASVTNVGLDALVDTSSYASMTNIDGLSIFEFGASKAFTRSRNNSNVSFAAGTNEATKLNELFAVANNNEASNAKATSNGFATIEGFKYAAQAVNDTVNNSNIDLSGKLALAGDLIIQSNTSDNVNVLAETTKVQLADVAGGVKAENTITNTANVNINGAEITADGFIYAVASNKVDFNQDYGRMLDANVYNLLGGEGSLAINTITQNANLNVGNTNKTTMTSGKAMLLGATSAEQIKSHAYQRVNGLIHETANLTVKDNFTFNENVNIGANSELKALNASDLTIAAWDEGLVDEWAYANAIGVSTTVSSKLGTESEKNKITHNAKINIGNNAKLSADYDVNLFAGKTLDNDYAVFKLNSLAEADSDGVIAWYVNPENNSELKRNNKVNINTGAVVTSRRNVELYANSGAEKLEVKQVRRTYYNNAQTDSDSFTYSSANGQIKKVASDTNEVKVDGKVIAGNAYKQVIVIGSNADGSSNVQIVALNSDEYEAIIAENKAGLGNGENKILIYVNAEGTDLKGTIGTSDGFTQVDEKTWSNGTFTLSNVDYANKLYERYKQLCELVQNYAVGKLNDENGTVTVTNADGTVKNNVEAYIGYYTELKRVEELMKTMGAVRLGTDGRIIDFKASSKVPTISLPDLVAYGGTINVNTHYLHGNGTLEANSNPEITVTNNTNMALQVNNVTLENAGGGVIYNGTTLTGTEEVKKNKIKEINASFVAGHAGDTVAHITGDNNPNGNKITIDSFFDGTIAIRNGEDTIEYSPLADTYINGYVNANAGDVSIHNKSHDIFVEGADASSSAGVNGNSISIVAEAGSVTQGYTDGIVNIGKSVRDQYSALYQAYISQIGTSTTSQIYSGITTTVKPTVNTINDNRISGKEIYINAADININGTIQSGYAKYSVTIGENEEDIAKVNSRIDVIQAAWEADGAKHLSDTQVMSSGDTYRVVAGGIALDTVAKDGSYIDKLDAYYNPATKQIVIPDVNAGGGKIYLTGRIASTGVKVLDNDGNVVTHSANIICMDGTNNINVINNTTKDLKLGDLKVNDVQGLIKITDTSTQKVTEITRQAVKSYNFFIKDANDKTIVNDGSVGATINSISSSNFADGNLVYTASGENAGLRYNPTTGLRYNWTTGKETGSTNHYTKTYNAWIWGAGSERNVTTTDYADPTPTVTPISYDDKNKPDGEFIGTLNGATGDFSVSYEYNELENNPSAATVDTFYTGFLWMNKHYEKKWTVESKTSQVYEASVKADNPINIKFIGNADKTSVVNVDSKGSVELSGNIGNSKAYTTTTTVDNVPKVTAAEKGTVQIASRGDVYQTGGRIYGENVVINVNGNIDIDNIVAGDNLNLTATIINDDSDKPLGQSINVNVNNRIVDGYATKANVALGQIGSIYTDYTNVKSYGDLTMMQGQAMGLVRGDYINLTSTNGSTNVLVDNVQRDSQRANLLFNGVNVSAKGDINLTQIDGDTRKDLRIGKVYSNEGDVTITTPGTLIDALPYGDADMSGETDAEMLQRYRDIGLLNDANKDNSAVIKARADEFREGVATDFAKYQELKTKLGTSFDQAKYAKYITDSDTYQAKVKEYGTDESKWTDAQRTEIKNLRDAINGLSRDEIVYGQLKEKFSNVVSIDDYLSVNAEYQARLKNEKVTANALLYALEDSVINNTTVSTSTKAANIIGKNITVNTGLGTGLLDGATEPISFADIAAGNDNGLVALKKLTNADASMVQFNAVYKDVDVKDAAGNVVGTRQVIDSSATTATITRKLPIGVQTLTDDGVINIGFSHETDYGDAFIEGRYDNVREEAVQNTALNIGSVEARPGGTLDKAVLGDVYIKSLGAITNANITAAGVLNSAAAVVKGNNVTLLAKENIGTNKAVITMDMTGKLIAVAEGVTNGDIYLEQVNNNQNLNIQSIAAANNIFVQADKNILMADIPDTTVQGYIQSTNGAINLVSTNGSIGKDESDNEKALRIKNSETLPQGEPEAVNVVTTKSLATDGQAAGQMEIMQKGVVSLIAKNSVVAEGVSSIYPEGVETDKPAGTPAGTMNVRVHGYGDNVLKDIKLHANGYLRVLDASAIEEGTIRSKDIEANNTIDLSSAYDLDMLANVKTNADNGTVVLRSDNNVSFLNGSINTATATVTAGESVNLRGGTITATAANITAGEKIVQTGSVYNKDNLTYIGNKLVVGTLVAEAGNGLDLHSWANELQNVSLYNANGDIALGNGGKETLNLLAVSGSKTDATAKLQGNVTIHNYDDKPVGIDSNVDTTTDNDIVVHNDILATGAVVITNDEIGKVEIVEGQEIVTAAIVTATDKKIAGGSVSINATVGSIDNSAAITAETSVNMTAGEKIYNRHDVGAGTYVEMVAEDELYSSGRIVAESANNNGKSIILNAGETLITTGALISGAKDISVDAGVSINNSTKISSTDGDIVMTAGKNIMNLNADGAEAGIEATKGNIVLTTTGEKTQGSIAFEGIQNAASIHAGQNVIFAKDYTSIDSLTYENAVYGAIVNRGSITAGSESNPESNVLLFAGKDLKNIGNIEAINNVVLTSRDNLLNGEDGNSGNIIAHKGYVDIDATKDLNNNAGLIQADKEITLNSWKGSANNTAEITSENGEVYIMAATIYTLDPAQLDDSDKAVVGNVENEGTIQAKNRVQITSLHGNVDNSATITSTAGMVSLSANDSDLASNHESVGKVQNLKDGSSVPNINAALDIVILAENMLINNGDLTVKNNGDIVVYAGQTAEGKIMGDCDVINTGKFTNESQDGNIYMYATGDVYNRGVMEAQYGSVEIGSTEGSIYNYAGADLYAGGGDVTLLASSKNLEAYYYGASGEKIVVNRDNDENFRENAVNKVLEYKDESGVWHEVITSGVIYNSGDAMALGKDNEGGTVTIKSEHGSVYNYDDFATLDNTDGLEYKRGKGAVESGGIMVATDNVELSAKEGFLYNDKDIVAGENVSLTAKNGLSNFAYNIEAYGNIDLVATDGNLFNNAQLISQTGDVNLTAENGTVVNLLGGDIFALGGDVSMTSGANKVDSNGQLKPNANTIYTVDNSNGDTKTLESQLTTGTEIAWPGDINDRIVTVDKYYKVGGDGEVKLIDQTVNVNGLTPAEKESVYSMINVVDDKGTPVPLTDTAGNALKVSGNVDVFRIGDTVNRGDIVALGSTTVDAAGNVVAEKPGTVHIRSEHGNVVNYDNFAMVDGVDQYQYAKNSKKYILAASGIGLEAPEGYFYNSLGYFTEGDLILEAEKDMTIGDNFSIGEVGGDIIVTSTQGKVANVSTNPLESKGNLILSGAQGVSSVGNLIAGDMLALGSKNGNIEAKEIAGKQVILYDVGATANSSIRVNTIKAGDYLAMEANNIAVSRIVNTGNGDLVMDITGPNGSTMQGNLKLTIDGSTLMHSLNVHNADIKVEGGSLGIDKLHVTGVGYFDAFDYNTSVYGEMPAWDGSKAMYYDLGKGSNYNKAVLPFDLDGLFFGNGDKKMAAKAIVDALPGYKAQTKQFNNANDGWMNLYIDSGNQQRSNGLLLHVDNKHYVHGQRFAGDELSRIITDAKAIDIYEQAIVPVIPQYFRLDLINDGYISINSGDEGFFKITNSNNILGELLNEEDMEGLEKLVLGKTTEKSE